MKMFGKKKDERPAIRTRPEDIISTVRSALESNQIKFNYVEDRKVFQTGFMGDDLPITAIIAIDDVNIHFACMLDLKAKVDNFKEVAWNLNCINKTLAYGSFFLDPNDGTITFEYGFPYTEANVSEGFILDFLKGTVHTVDQYDGDLKTMAEKGNTRCDDRMFA
ncbi:MAG: hypothetical protein E7Z64_01200 [Thermoplasmata archaeon]|nr:hypothetical protein [Thermoplasmata archaeon]